MNYTAKLGFHKQIAGSFFANFAGLVYAIVDIETTGGNAKTGRITEVAIYRHNGNRVVDAFSSLVRPDCEIPPFVVNLTGITNEMVAEAPPFEEIAEDILEITAGCVFVAHNVAFDYEYIKQEFKRIGVAYRRRKLCTVQLSRQVFTGLPSYSLGKLTKQLDIKLDNHHRAAADALATVHIFEKLIVNNTQAGLFEDDRVESALEGIDSDFIDRDTLENLPEETGVYRFLDSDGQPLFVKRSLHLAEGVLDKLKNNESKNIRQLKESLDTIVYDSTGSQLLAGLIEIDEVIRFEPQFNHGKFSLKPAAAIVAVPENGNECTLEVRKYFRDLSAAPIAVYKNFKGAREALDKVGSTLGLQRKPTRKSSGWKSAFNEYLATDDQLEEIQEFLAFNGRSFIIRDEGPSIGQQSIIRVENGTEISVGIISNQDDRPVQEILETELRPLRFHPAMVMLIDQTISKDRSMKPEPLSMSSRAGNGFS